MTKTDQEWRNQAKRLLRVELVKNGITYAELARRLARIGVKETEPNLRNKISRGRFSVVFLLQCFEAIED